MPTKHVTITPAIAAWVRMQHGETPIAITDDGTVMWVACESGKTLALVRGDYLDPEVPMPEPKHEAPLTERDKQLLQQKLDAEYQQVPTRAERRRQQRQQQRQKDNNPQPQTPRGEHKQEQPPPTPPPPTEDERWALAEARAGELVVAATGDKKCVRSYGGKLLAKTCVGACSTSLYLVKGFSRPKLKYLLCEVHARLWIAKHGTEKLDADD